MKIEFIQPGKELVSIGSLKVGDFYITKTGQAVCLVLSREQVNGTNGVELKGMPSVSLHTGSIYFDAPNHPVYHVNLVQVGLTYVVKGDKDR